MFLAAQDGGLVTASILLSNFANRNSGDNMDVSPVDIALKTGNHDIVKLFSDWTNYGGSPHAIGPNSPPSKKSPLRIGTISPTPAGVFSDILPKCNVNMINGHHITHGVNSKPRKRKMNNRNTKGKSHKNRELKSDNFPVYSEIPMTHYDYPTPRSSTENQMSLPDLSDTEILQGMEWVESIL